RPGDRHEPGPDRRGRRMPRAPRQPPGRLHAGAARRHAVARRFGRSDAGRMTAAGAWLTARIGAGEVVVLDRGMGTELQARGVPMDNEAWSGVANLTHEDVVREIHEDFIRAGADVIIANTYAAARSGLERAGYGDRVAEANRRAVEAAVEARERAAD